MVALTVHLGLWQRDRAQEKRARQAMLDARLRDPPVRLTGMVPDADALLFRRVRASGEWMAGRQVFLDNQVHAGRAGFFVVTPLRLNGSDDAVLVNRGWIARDANYPRPPRVTVPEGAVEVTGLATRPPARYLELSTQAVTGEVWQNLTIERFRTQTGLRVLPVIVLADTAGPGLVAVHERPDAGVAKHEEYELTWFALAATTLVLWVALNLKRRR
jgi:surfeit locus 1 family protein